jgi:ABC-type branched-subunit amino acid transport system substrate-binding protein
MRTLKRLVTCAAITAGAISFGGVGGCAGSGTTTPKASGARLTIYLSDPSATAAQYADVVDAERLAFRRSSHALGRLDVRLRILGRSPSANARTAIQDSSTIAYLGELEPGASADSVGITNDEDVLQVSPTDTALELTRSTPAVKGAPGDYYESLKSYGRTFARVVPTSAAEARAEVMEMRALGVHKVYVCDDGSPYGRAFAYALKHDLGAPVIAVGGPPVASRVSASGADAVFFAGRSVDTAATLFNSIAGSAPKTKLLAPSALYTPSFGARLSAVARANTYVSSPGFLARELPASAHSQFVAPFEAAYRHPPAPQAIFGYEAMSALLAVLHQAGSGVNQRATVVRDFMELHRHSSVLGSYSINRYGDPTTAPFVIARVRGGALTPYRFEQAGG